MKKKQWYLVFMVLSSMTINSGYAQQSINTSSESITSSSGSMSYTVGQIAQLTALGLGGSASAGVQQVYEITMVGFSEENSHLSLTIFPNPTVNDLTIEIKDYSGETFICRLFDLHGKDLISKPIISQQTVLNASFLPSSTYFIAITNQKNQVIQLFKIVKK